MINVIVGFEARLALLLNLYLIDNLNAEASLEILEATSASTGCLVALAKAGQVKGALVESARLKCCISTAREVEIKSNPALLSPINAETAACSSPIGLLKIAAAKIHVSCFWSIISSCSTLCSLMLSAEALNYVGSIRYLFQCKTG